MQEHSQDHCPVTRLRQSGAFEADGAVRDESVDKAREIHDELLDQR